MNESEIRPRKPFWSSWGNRCSTSFRVQLILPKRSQSAFIPKALNLSSIWRTVAVLLPTPTQETLFYFAAGRAHWADHCATCHGNDGSGLTQVGQNLYPKAPDMRLSATQNLSDGELYYIIVNGVRLTGMLAWGAAGTGEADENWYLVSFIRHLPQITPEELDEMKGLNPKTEADRAEDQQEQEFLKGGEPSQNPGATHHH